MKIIHFTTVHPRYDVRIFFKQCVSLAKENEVTLYVADGLKDEQKDKVNIIDIGDYRNNRLKRITLAQKILKAELQKTSADIYQFHDPELLRVGKWLKKRGKIVIYDSHEDVTKQILYKTWLGPLWFRKFLSKKFYSYLQNITNKFDGVISVIDEITEKFRNQNRITIKNYPILSFIESKRKPIEERKKQIIYLGSLSKVRGIKDYIQAMQDVPEEYKLVLVGAFSSEEFEKECKELDLWKRVDFRGFQPMEKSIEILSNSIVALSVLHPEKNYLTSLPTKGFEYMAAGVPTVISDFEYWRPFFKECTLMIEPENPELIAESINKIINSSELNKELISKGVEQSKKFSWEKEAEKLIDFYQKIIKKRSTS